MVHVIMKERQSFRPRTSKAIHDLPNAHNTKRIIEDDGSQDLGHERTVSRQEEKEMIYKGLNKAVKDGDGFAKHVYKKILNNTKNGN